MNERIRELYSQAVEYSNRQMTFSDTRECFAEKFAELIVQECVEVARQADIDGCNVGNYAWEKINQHFGVEE
jgi:hypothetical protein